MHFGVAEKMINLVPNNENKEMQTHELDTRLKYF